MERIRAQFVASCRLELFASSMRPHSPRLITRFRACLVLALVAPLAVGCASTPAAGGAGAGAGGAPPTSASGAGGTTIVAISPPAAPQQNLLDFLGITAIGKCLGQGFTCLGGLLPNIIPGFNSGLGELANMPPVLPINDPANLKSPNPAVAAAAAAKRDEDAAPQKIAALEYLATRGCSSCVVGAEEAMYSGLEDCTESVRYAAATAIFEAAGKPCRVCKGATCCSARIRQKLWDLGYKLKEDGCPAEPSSRVRRTARLALRACGPDCNPQTPPPVPTEGPDLEMPTPVNPPPRPAETTADARVTEIPNAPPSSAPR